MSIYTLIPCKFEKYHNNLDVQVLYAVCRIRHYRGELIRHRNRIIVRDKLTMRQVCRFCEIEEKDINNKRLFVCTAINKQKQTNEINSKMLFLSLVLWF